MVVERKRNRLIEKKEKSEMIGMNDLKINQES